MSPSKYLLLILLLDIFPTVVPFFVSPFQVPTFSSTTTKSASGLNAAKGFGGGGAAVSKKTKKKKPPSPKQLLKQLKIKYGGTSPQDIARGTQQIMDQQRQALPPSLQLSLNLYQQLQQWNYQLRGMTVLQQANLPPQQMEGAKRAQEELNKLLSEQNITEDELHNLLQQMTWDASADAKAIRSITGEMPSDIQRLVTKACKELFPVDSPQKDDNELTVLDVGCGFGVLVPYFQKVLGLKESQIYGVDLSAEMIKNAKTMYPDGNWEAEDFFRYSAPEKLFDGIMFCSSLHDLPNLMHALEHAVTLLKDGGRVVVVHPQGASHVLNQVRANPVLVQRGLPTVEELKNLDKLKLIKEPAMAKSRQEKIDGYLAVLQKTSM